MGKNNGRGSNLGPRPRQPRPAVGPQIINDVPHDQISFDKGWFNDFIQSQGVRVKHFRGIPDPRGQTSRGDTHDVLGVRDSSDGYIYREAGCLQVFFQSNNTDATMENEGVLDTSSAYITLPTNYDNGDPVLVADYDRFYLEDIEIRVINKQKMEFNVTGIDRLQFPATCVELLIDANGVEYKEDVDFAIDQDGNIRWTGQKRPGYNEKTGRGTVYSIRYRYVPFFVVDHMVHEIRVAQITDPNTFDRSLERMPYQAFVIREKVFLDRNRSPENRVTENNRLQYAPPSGGALGPK